MGQSGSERHGQQGTARWDADGREPTTSSDAHAVQRVKGQLPSTVDGPQRVKLWTGLATRVTLDSFFALAPQTTYPTFQYRHHQRHSFLSSSPWVTFSISSFSLSLGSGPVVFPSRSTHTSTRRP